MQISDWQIAEENAARWMRFWGYPDAHVTGGGADGGVDVISGSAIAQVKFRASVVGGPDLQRLAGAGHSHRGKALFFFTGSGYSSQALQVAGIADIALFTYRLDGSVSPVNNFAEQIANTPMTTSSPARGNSRPKDSVSGFLGLYIVLAGVAGLFCFISGLNSPDGASTFRAFISFVLLFIGGMLLLLAWVMWGVLKASANRPDS